MPTAYLALGSNLGDRRAHLEAALNTLADQPGHRLLRVSSVYETAPVGPAGQGAFYNLVAALETPLGPHQLLDLTLAIEMARGRVRREHWGPRTLDIDILVLDGTSLHEPRLTIPHPRMAGRAFVMVPLAEIAPDLPVAGRRAFDLAKDLDPSGVHRRPEVVLNLRGPAGR